jgi:hypothetical protein
MRRQKVAQDPGGATALTWWEPSGCRPCPRERHGRPGCCGGDGFRWGQRQLPGGSGHSPGAHSPQPHTGQSAPWHPPGPPRPPCGWGSPHSSHGLQWLRFATVCRGASHNTRQTSHWCGYREHRELVRGAPGSGQTALPPSHGWGDRDSQEGRSPRQPAPGLNMPPLCSVFRNALTVFPCWPAQGWVGTDSPILQVRKLQAQGGCAALARDF